MDRLASNGSRVDEILQRLEQQRAVEELLGAADKDLREVGMSVVQLAASTRAAAESLNEILVEFRSAVQVIQQADPARVAAAVAETQEFIARQHAETQSALQASAAEGAKRHVETRTALAATLAATEDANAHRHAETQTALQALADASAQRHTETQAALVTSEQEGSRRHGEMQDTLSRQSADANRGLSRLWGLGWGIVIAQAVGLALLGYMAFVQ